MMSKAEGQSIEPRNYYSCFPQPKYAINSSMYIELRSFVGAFPTRVVLVITLSMQGDRHASLP
jgi:hypothetical protein